MERESGMDEDHATHTQTHTHLPAPCLLLLLLLLVSLSVLLYSPLPVNVFSVFSSFGVSPCLSRALLPQSAARAIFLRWHGY